MLSQGVFSFGNAKNYKPLPPKTLNMFSQTNSLWLVRQCTQPLSAAFKRSKRHSEINIASLAQLVEHSGTNREVASSILAWSKKLLTFTLRAFSLWFVFVIVPGRKSTHLHKDSIQFSVHIKALKIQQQQ